MLDILEQRGLTAWADHLSELCGQRLTADAHGLMSDWMAAWEALPDSELGELDCSGPTVRVCGQTLQSIEELRATLMRFHPWRKGPFELFGLAIDAEWRSNWKWDRIAGAIDFTNKTVLDVGCGNGYYGWRMLAAGADLVIGCDPFPLYWMQFEVFRRYAKQPERHWVIPLADDDLPSILSAFDLTLSMGVLYHRQQPQEHLARLRTTLVPGGQLLIETLVIESEARMSLTPSGRYAKMRNIGVIPSLALLTDWLKDCDYCDIKIIDVSRTTNSEQRRTAWMTFESLNEFLDPNDHLLTIEGHPAPIRAVLSARRSQ